MFRPLLTAAAFAGLAACQPADTDASSPEPSASAEAAATESATPVPSREATKAPTQASAAATAASEAGDSQCGADKVAGRWLNSLPTDDVKADIVAKVGDRPIRYYTQGDPITMDFNPERLNVELGEDGRIKVFRCG